MTKLFQLGVYRLLATFKIKYTEDFGLKESLEQFYNEYSSYDSFVSPRDFSYLYEYIASFSPKNVIEIGCGVSNAFIYFNKLGVVYHAQDITNQNITFYADNNVTFFNTNVAKITNSYDVVFSTYVFEHVTDPIVFLESQLALLNDCGKLIIECPNYMLPFHVPPSLRHYSLSKQILLTILLFFESSFGKAPIFLINSNPAFFHLQWKRDYDAINIISYRRLKRFCKSRGLNCSKNLFSVFSKKFYTSQLICISKK